MVNTAVNSTETTAVHFNQRAEIYLSQGKIEEAIVAVEQALKIKPNFAPAFKTLGNALQAQGRMEEARHWYQKAIEIQPQFAEVYANLGSIYAQEQKWPEAIEHYQKAIAIKPNFAGVYRNLARLFSQMGKQEQAAESWYQAFALEPQKIPPEEHFNLGETLLAQGKLDQAIASYRRAIELKPDWAAAYQNLGEALKRQGKTEEAAACYRRAIELNGANASIGNQGQDTLGVVEVSNPIGNQGQDTLAAVQQQGARVAAQPVAPAINIEDAEAYIILGQGYFDQGKYEQAIAACKRAIQIKPDAVAVYKTLGNALQAVGKAEEALNWYARAVELKPDFAEVHANIGSVYAQQQKWQPAIAAYQKAISLKPDFAGAYRNFAKVWTQVGRSVEAAECWYRSFQLDPSKATADELLNLANAFLEQGKADKALGCLSRTVQLNPASAEAHQKLAEVLKSQGQWQEAATAYRKAVAIDPENGWVYSSLAEVLAKLERWEEVVAAYRKAIEFQPGHSWSHNNLGDALIKLERWEEAVAAYQRAIALKPDFFWSHNNLGDALIKLEQWEEAVAAYKGANQIQGDFFWSYNNLGDALRKLEQWEEAVLAYQRGIELDPNQAWTQNNLGEALFKLERWEEAAVAYRRATALNPDFPWSHYQLGEVLAELADWDGAIAAYRNAQKIKADLPWISVKLGDALRKRAQADLEAASEFYQLAIAENPDDVQLYHKALEVKPNDPDLYLQLADTLLRKGWADGAVVFYQMGLQVQPDHPELSQRLEEVLEKKKGVNKAIASTPTSTPSSQDRSQDDYFAPHQRAEELQKQGKLEEAIAAYRQAIEINPNYHGTFHNLGDIYQQKGKLEEAVTSYRKAIELKPDYAWSHHNLGDALLRQEKLEEAAAAYRKALDIDPNFAWAHYNLGRALNQQDKLYEALGHYQRANELDRNLFPLDLQVLREGLLQSQDAYTRWRAKNFPRESDLRQMVATVELLNYKPLISVIVPAYNTPEEFLREAIESVRNQVYPYWELCIADDASTAPHVRKVLEEYKAKDGRIKVAYRTQNGHISRASNSALEIATGEFITLLDHDDLMTPDALYEVALMLNRHPEADMIYSDEDKLTADGKLIGPYFKPEWCPDSFLSRMYTCHLGTYRRSIIKEIGGFRAGFEGAQDYDLVLRFTEKTNKIYHIPKVLYHWRMHSGSTAGSTEAKPYAYEASIKALQEAIDRRGEPGRIEEVPDYLGHYIVRYQIRDYKLVSIIIPTRDHGDVLDKCLESIFTKSVYPNYEVIVIDNGSREKQTAEVFAKWTVKEPNRFKCYPLDIPFNFSKINNYAVSKARGDYLLFLNNDTEVITSDWIDAMVEQAQRSSIGAVGVKLLYPDHTIQHAGVVVGILGVAGHIYIGFPSNFPGYFSNVVGMNNLSAVTGACLMCRREVFEQVGGFDEELAVAYNDVDLCLKLTVKGYYNIYVPHVSLYHHESKSRGYEDTPEKQARWRKEADLLERRWPQFIDNDPCYSPHLTRSRQDFSIRA
ncbi:MAG: tetratricopeptide repeat protein [Actinomycetota bacterium]